MRRGDYARLAEDAQGSGSVPIHATVVTRTPIDGDQTRLTHL